MITKGLLTIAFVLVTFIGFSKSDPQYAVMPKATNLQEIVRSIEYPMATKESAIEGKVLMLVDIDAEGNVISKTALAYPCAKMKAAVEQAMDDLKFEPAKDKNGLAIASSVRIPVDFELKID